jgi:hypothetical protein
MVRQRDGTLQLLIADSTVGRFLLRSHRWSLGVSAVLVCDDVPDGRLGLV